jgi:AcrR family transcriptional regulator
MPRMSRVESQARTREQLIDTATTLFLRDGYFATSLTKVADEAGFSTGAVYSNFASKSALAMVVLQRLQEFHVGGLLEAFAKHATFEAKLTAIETWAENAIGESGWPRLEFEFALEASQDKGLVRETIERERLARDLLSEIIEHEVRAHGLKTLVPAKELARIVLSLGIGLAVQHLVDPKVSSKTLTNALRALITKA